MLEASNQVIRQLRKAWGESCQIIGVGGVLSAQDAVGKIKAGADLVKINTGLIYKRSMVVKEFALAVRSFLQETADI